MRSRRQSQASVARLARGPSPCSGVVAVPAANFGGSGIAKRRSDACCALQDSAHARSGDTGGPGDERCEDTRQRDPTRTCADHATCAAQRGVAAVSDSIAARLSGPLPWHASAQSGSLRKAPASRDAIERRRRAAGSARHRAAARVRESPRSRSPGSAPSNARCPSAFRRAPREREEVRAVIDRLSFGQLRGHVLHGADHRA